MIRDATPLQRAYWGVPDDAVCRVADGEFETVTVDEPGGWAVALERGSNAYARGPNGHAEALGSIGHALATGSIGHAEATGAEGTERDSRSPSVRYAILSPSGVEYPCAVGEGWLRVGCEVHPIDEWLSRGDEIAGQYGVRITREMMDWAQWLKDEEY